MRKAFKDGQLSYLPSDYEQCFKFDKGRFDAMLKKELWELRKTEQKCQQKQLLKDKQKRDRQIADALK